MMNQVSTPLTEEISWITLKEAARMLGCSVKTIRRRVKGGTWRSMIEYQGQKAIRLVAREDVLKETSALDRLPADSPEAALALQALDGLPAQLGDVLKSYLSHLKKEMDRASRIWRLYLLLAVGAAAIISGGLGYYFSQRQGKALEGRLGEMSRTLSTTFSRGQDELGREVSRLSGLAEENQRLTEEAGRRGERQERNLESLLESLRKLEEANRITREEAAAARDEIDSLRREIERRDSGQRGAEADPAEGGEISPPPGEENRGADTPPPDAGRRDPETERSRFLGIF
jgi:hypothetical protein